MKLDVELLDPTLRQLGALIGLLKIEDGCVHVNAEWFEDPIKYIHQIPTTRANEIVELLQGLMGSTTGHALGTPVESGNENRKRRWYPIQAIRDSDQGLDLTGLFVVSDQDARDENSLTLGLGLLKNFPEDSLVFTPYVFVPIVHLPPAEGQTVFSAAPVELGMSLTREGGFGEETDPVSFDGLKISTYLYLTDPPKGTTVADRKKPLEIVLLNLKLPGITAANVSLIDLILKTTQKDPAAINEWLTIGVSVLATQLSKATASTGGSAAARQVAHMTVDLLSLLGLTGQTPALDWQKLFESTPHFKGIFDDWFVRIAGSSATMKTWLNEVFCLFKGELTDPGQTDVNVGGQGTRANPWSIEMLSIQDTVTLGLTVAVEHPPDQPLAVYPGLRIFSNLFKPMETISQLGVQLQASVELFQMTFDQGGPSPSRRSPTTEELIFPSFDVLIQLRNPQPDQPLISIQGAVSTDAPKNEDLAAFRLDTIEVGFGCGEIKEGTGRVFAPHFRLTNVQTSIGVWPVIDFRNFSDVVQVVEQAVSSLIETVVQEYLGDESSRYAASLLVALGIRPPAGLPADAWPIKQFLLSPENLELVVKNPLLALATYYTRALTAEISEAKIGKTITAWQAMLPDIARLLSGLSIDVIDVEGTGSAADPWLAPLISLEPQKPNVFLQTWIDDQSSPDQSPQLHLGLKIDVPIVLSAVRIDVGGVLGFVGLRLPDTAGTGQIGAQWLTPVYSYIEVRNPEYNQALTTPQLAGLSLSAARGLILCGWTRAQGLYFAAQMLEIAVSAQGLATPVEIGDLIFELGTEPWSKENLSTFAKITVYIAGLSLLELGGRFGLMAAATLGLLPNLPSIIKKDPDPELPFQVPQGVALPQDHPVLEVSDPASFFTQPWADLKKHLSALFASRNYVQPLLQIWGWAITQKVPAVPQPVPAGSFSDPWSVRFDNLRDLELLFWTEKADDKTDTPAVIGTGMQRSMSAQSTLGIELDVVARLKAFRIPLADTPLTSTHPLPVLSVTGRLGSSSGAELLVRNEMLGIEIERVELGFSMDLSSLQTEGLLAPVLVFKKAKLDGRDLGDVYLQPLAGKPIFTSSGSMPDLERLLNALMVRLSDELRGKTPESDLLQHVLLLLCDLGLVRIQPVAGKSPDGAQEFSTNPAAWQALLANPGAYLRARVNQILDDAQRTTQWFQHLGSILGLEHVTLPAALDGLPAVLVALGLIRPAASGYGILLSNWLSLFKGPRHFMQTRAARLLTDVDLRRQLITELSRLPAPPRNVPLSLRVISGARIKISTSAEAPIPLGSELVLLADVNFDLENLALEVGGGLRITALGTAVVFRDTLSLNPDLSLTNRWQVLLQASPDDSPPPFDPLVFYPLPDDKAVETYLLELGKRLPVWILSFVAGKYLNQYVLTEDHPLALRLFRDLGLARPIGAEPPRLRSLTRVLIDPLAWFLSPDVIGKEGGGIDLDKVGRLLSGLPDPDGTRGPADIVIRPVDHTGLEIAKLPYGMSLNLAAAETKGIRMAVTVDYPSQAQAATARGAGRGNLPEDMAFHATAGLAFGLGAGVQVHGDVGITYQLNRDGTYVKLDTGYRDERFTLDIAGALQGTNPKTIKLVPFGGLNQFIPDAKEGGKLLDYISGKISSGYQEYRRKPDHNRALVDLVDEAVSVAGIFDIHKAGDIIRAVERIQENPVQWLCKPFDPQKIEATLGAINSLFKKADLDIFEQDGPLLKFTPNVKADMGCVVIMFGSRTILAQGNPKSVFGVWVEPQIKKSVLVLDITAGVGILLPFSDPVFDFLLSAALSADLTAIPAAALTRGPELRLAIDFNTKTGIQPPALNLLPLGESPNTPVVSILPELYLAFADAPATRVTVDTWLLRFAVQFLIPLTVDTVLQLQAVNSLLTRPLVPPKPVNFAQILKNCKLISEVPELKPVRYRLNDIIATYGGMSIERVIATLAYGTLTSFVAGGDSLPIIKFTHGSLNLVGAKAAQDSIAYGLNVQVYDLALSGRSSPNQQDNRNPNGGCVELLLQLGKWLRGEENQTSWLKRAYPEWAGTDPGMTLYLVNARGPSDVNFIVNLELASIGMDIRGQNQAALVDTHGFRLGALEPRLFFAMGVDLNQHRIEGLKFGGALRVDGLGVPLGPGFGELAAKKDGTPNNPVAQNLLSSSSSEPGGGQSAGEPNTNAVNPTFSLAVDYVYREEFDLLLYDDKNPTQPTDLITLPIQRQFGPIQVRKIGIGWHKANKLAKFLFDGAVGLLGLHAEVIDLIIGIPITHPGDFGSYTLDLAGLDISFEAGPVTISGGFLKTQKPGDKYPEYAGLGVIQAAKFGLTAVGAYGMVEAPDGRLQPSLTIFALLSAPIGGIPAFFITGIAAGFGFNRGFIPPDIHAVEKFPLIAGLDDPAQLGDGGISGVLTALHDSLPPRLGAYWLAAGLKFTSFQLVRGLAIASVQFGKEFEIAILGLASIQLPKKALSGLTPYVYAELGIRVLFNPQQGLFAVSAVLTPNSYVIDPNCRLTGGFAFCIWYAPNPNAGDFVLTIGGYGPVYDPPSHYPGMDAVGFNWHVSRSVTIKGGAYFALTPRAVMAGGRLEAVYQSGGLRAWFIAHADFLISWKPFHYYISVGISIGVSYTVTLIVTTTFKVELGVEVELWGPRLAGRARISWWVISFTLSFGAEDSAKAPPKAVDWPSFDCYFLPQGSADICRQKRMRSSRRLRTETAVPLQTDQQVCRATVVKGLVRSVNVKPDGTLSDQPADDTISLWIVRADQLVISTQTVIPATTIIFDSRDGTSKDPIEAGQDGYVGIRPMAAGQIHSTHRVTINTIGEDGTDSPQEIDISRWTASPSKSAVPAALWDTSTNVNTQPKDATLADRLVGLDSFQPEFPQIGAPIEINIKDHLNYLDLDDRRLPLARSTPTNPQPRLSETSLDAIEQTVMHADVVKNRGAVLQAIIDQGINVQTDGRLDVLAAYAQTSFTGSPMLGHLAATTTRATAHAGRLRSVKAQTKFRAAPVKPKPAKLKAVMRRYASPYTADFLVHATRGRGGDLRRDFRVAFTSHGHVHRLNPFASAQSGKLVERAVSRTRIATPGARRNMLVEVGKSFLWDIDSQHAHRRSLHFDQQLPVRVTTFDRHAAVIADRIVSARTYRLPEGSAQVVLTGLAPDADSRLVGWHADALLVQVNPIALLGEGVIIRPQAPHVVPQGRYRAGFGLKAAQALIEQNTIETLDGSPKQGWIITVMPAAVGSLVLCLRRTGNAVIDPAEVADKVDVRLSWVRPGTTQTDAVALTDPLDVRTNPAANEALITYKVPAALLEGADVLLRTFVTTEAGWLQTGLFGIAGEAQKAARAAPKVNLPDHGHASRQVLDHQSVVELVEL